MASDRDTLEDLLLNARIDAKTVDETADDLLAAGWRPPAQVIERFEVLEEAPVGMVIRDAHGDIAISVAVDTWEKTGCDLNFNSQFFYYPVQVLWFPAGTE